MRAPTLSRRSASIAAVAAVLAPLSLAMPGNAGAAGVDAVNCSASILYEASNATGVVVSQPYSVAFSVSAAASFTKDTSTALRAETFSATLVGGAVEVSYLHDVGVFDDVQLNVTAPMRGTAKGRSEYGQSTLVTAGPPVHVTSYTISCRRA